MEYTSLKNFVITENLKDTAKTFYNTNVIGRELLTSYDLVMDHFKNCHNHAIAAAAPVIYENQDESDIYYNYNASSVSSLANNQFSGKLSNKR